jgi:hypothetical protein
MAQDNKATKKKKKIISLGHFENYQLYNNLMKVCNDIEK